MKFIPLKNNKLILLGIILCSCMTAYTASAIFSRPFAVCEQAVFMLFSSLRHQVKNDERISHHLRMISINEKDVVNLNIKNDDRTIFGEMINVVAQAKPALIVMDIIFKDNPRVKGNQELVKYTREAGNVFYPIFINEENNTLNNDANLPAILEKLRLHIKIPDQKEPSTVHNIKSYPFYDLFQAAHGLGDISMVFDPHDRLIRIPLISFSYNEAIPSLVLRSICYFFDVNEENIIIHSGKYIKLINAKLPDGRIEDFFIPIDNDGKMLVNFIETPEIQENVFQASQIFNEFNNNNIKEAFLFKFLNSFVIVSENIKNNEDSGNDDINQIYPHSMILFNSINTILTEQFIYKPDAAVHICLAIVLAFLLWLGSVDQSLKKLYPAAFFLFILLLCINFVFFFFFHQLTVILPHLAALVLSVLFIHIFYNLSKKNNPEQVPTPVDTGIGSQEQITTPVSSPAEMEFRIYGTMKKYKEIIDLLLEGYEYKEISSKLKLNINTVKKKIQKIYKECGVQNKIELFNFLLKKDD